VVWCVDIVASICVREVTANIQTLLTGNRCRHSPLA